MTESQLSSIVRGVVPVVRDLITKSVSEIGSRLSAAEARLTAWSEQERTLGDLRERVVVMETKAAIPLIIPPPVDVAPVLARVSAVEATLAAMPARDAAVLELRDRLTSVEVKSSLPVTHAEQAVDLGPVLERLTAMESRLAIVSDVRDRIVAVEGKSLAAPAPAVDAELRERLAASEARVSVLESALASVAAMRDRVAMLEGRGPDESATKSMAAISERIAVLETRAPVPGPQGPPGAAGAAGRDGSLEGLKAVHDGERTLVLCLKDGTPIDGGTVVMPIVLDRGVYQAGRNYQKGDAVSFGGSLHIAQTATTSKPEDGSSSGWRLAVKRGRDGKDGKDAPGALPVVRLS